MIEIVPQLLLNGMLLGGIYALAAVGLSLIYGVLGVVNFAHGEFYMVGGYAMLVLVRSLGLPYLLSIPLSLFLTLVLGLLVERIVIRALLEEPFEASIVATMAISFILINSIQYVFTATPRTVPASYGGSIVLGMLFLPVKRIVAFVVAILLFLTTHLFLQKTKLGIAIRAVSQNKEGASVAGIKIDRVSSFTFAIGAGLAGTAGAFMAPEFGIFPTAGQSMVLKSFAAVITGGFGDVRGAIIAAFVLGLGESLLGGLVSATLKDALGFLLMIAVLQFRPNGLFGKAVRAL